MTRKNRAFGVLVSAAIVASVLVALSTASALTNCSVSLSDQAIDSEEQTLLNLLNQYRTNNGKNPLSLSSDVTRAAAWFSRDMATKNYFPADHVDSFGRSLGPRLTQCDVPFTQAFENIAAGNATAQATFEQWRLSPGHNTNMLRDGITFAGVARSFNAASTYGWYWVLDLTAGGSSPSTSSTSTSTSTSSTSTSSTSTSSTSTSTTSSTSTSTSTTSSTSTTIGQTPTTTSTTTLSTTSSTSTSSTSTSTPTTPTTTPTTSTTGPTPTTGPTTTITVPGTGCGHFEVQRTRINVEFDKAETALRNRLTGNELEAALAVLQHVRTRANAQLDESSARAGCPPPTVA